MSRTEIRKRFHPHPVWLKDLRGAWDRLTERGRKKKVQGAAGITRSTAHRITTALENPEHLEEISLDTLEALRDALNKELDISLPPPVARVRSAAHHEAIGFAEQLDEEGTLGQFAAWISVGKRLASAGILTEILDALERRAGAEEAIDQSNEAISAPLPRVVEPTSDPPAKHSHGRGRHRETG